MIDITSADNPRYRRLLNLLASGRERRKTGLTVLDGAHLLQAFRARGGAPREVAVSRTGLAVAEIAALVAAEPHALVLPDALFKTLSTVATPTGILAVVPMPPVRAPGPDIGACVVIDGVQDPGNLGSILRSAAAAGVADVLMTAGCAQAWSPRVLRAGMGAHFALRLYESCDVAAFAAGYRGRLLAAVREARCTVFEADLAGDVGIMVGNEGAGLSAPLLGLAAEQVTIPMPGAAESLNVAAAAAVCLFERVRQQQRR